MHVPEQICDWLHQRQSLICHRQLLVIAGSHCWVNDAVNGLIESERPASLCWIGHSSSKSSCPINSYRQLLGQEFEWLVYDSFDGFRANALMACSGSVAKRGLMVLLCPPLERWPQFRDPQITERVSFGFEKHFISSRFIKRLVSLINQTSEVALWSPTGVNTSLPLASPCHFNQIDRSCVTNDQQRAVEEIADMASKANVNLVIKADRGRGKSAALGIAASRLAFKQDWRIGITAAHKSMAAKVFEHALMEISLQENPQRTLTDFLFYLPFDQLLAETPQFDLMIVDEAATIPNPILEKITNHYPRVVFSTTVHGYEGSGRGFELRFLSFLRQHESPMKSLTLQQPIRWFEDDVLEQFWFKAMAMTTLEECHDNQPLNSIKQVHFQTLDRDWLSDPDSAVLEQIFQLLVAAHYRTTPDDLLRLLDAPDYSLHVLQDNQQQVLGVALTANEGGVSLEQLGDDIAQGSRRVKGHLTAQKLAFETCQPQLAQRSYMRIVRVAVNQNYQHQGLGSLLLKHLKRIALKQSMDYLSASFGLTKSLVDFWQSNQFSLVNIGLKRDASSGEFNALVMHPVGTPENSELNMLEIACRLQTQYFSQFQELPKGLFNSQLNEELQEKWGSALHLLATRNVNEFLQQRRPLWGVRWHIYCCLEHIKQADRSRISDPFLYDLLYLQLPSTQLTQKYQLKGKKHIEALARKNLQALLDTMQGGR